MPGLLILTEVNYALGTPRRSAGSLVFGPSRPRRGWNASPVPSARGGSVDVQRIQRSLEDALTRASKAADSQRIAGHAIDRGCPAEFEIGRQTKELFSGSFNIEQRRILDSRIVAMVARYYGSEMENPYKAAQGSMLVWVISFKGLRLATTSGLKPIDLHLACDPCRSLTC